MPTLRRLGTDREVACRFAEEIAAEGRAATHGGTP
jgi:hypothetical protein